MKDRATLNFAVADQLSTRRTRLPSMKTAALPNVGPVALTQVTPVPRNRNVVEAPARSSRTKAPPDALALVPRGQVSRSDGLAVVVVPTLKPSTTTWVSVALLAPLRPRTTILTVCALADRPETVRATFQCAPAA